MSGEQLDQTAPMLAQARNAMLVCGVFGMQETTRSPAFTPIRFRYPARAPVSAANRSQPMCSVAPRSLRAISAGQAGVAFLKACSA